MPQQQYCKAAIGWWPAACIIKLAGVCHLRMTCLQNVSYSLINNHIGISTWMLIVQWWHGSGSCLPAELLQAVRFHVWSWLANTTDDRAIAGYRLSKHRLPSCWHQEGAAGPGTARRCWEIHRRCRCRSKNPNDICRPVQSWHGSGLFYLTHFIVSYY